MNAQPSRARLAVLISGRGRNLIALHEAIQAGHIAADLVCVLSNEPDAGGLRYARDTGLPAVVVPHRAFPDRATFDAAIAHALQAHRPDIIALAGFMRILTPAFVEAHAGRLLNIHPSLLPKHKGLHTHEAVLAAGDVEHGATVHFVTAQLDGGPAIIQGRFTVDPQDDAQALAARVLQQVELKIYPQAVAWMARGELAFDGGRTRFRGQPLDRPLGLDDLEPPFR